MPRRPARRSATSRFSTLIKLRDQPALRVVPPYYDEPVYIEALAASIEAELTRLPFKPELILASFHGIPKSYAEEGDPYPPHCAETVRLLRERHEARRQQADADVPVAFRPRRMAAALHRQDRGGAGASAA